MYEAGNFGRYAYLPSHVHPVADVCAYPKTAFNSFLRIEQMDLWFDTFMRHYGLGRFSEMLGEDGFAFYKPLLNSTTKLSEKLGKALGQKSWTGEANDTGRKHIGNSASRLAEHYTPVLARKVFDLQRVDFETFGYPAWDGDPTHFNFV